MMTGEKIRLSLRLLGAPCSAVYQARVRVRVEHTLVLHDMVPLVPLRAVSGVGCTSFSSSSLVFSQRWLLDFG